jgi:cytochrome c-type biogenesis protein CcsB
VTVAVDATLAGLSNQLVYSAMAVYAGALGAFAVDLSTRGPARVEVLVGPDGEAVPDERSGRFDGSSPGSSPGSSSDGSSSGSSKAAGIAVTLTWLAFVLHLAAVVTRGASVQRAPWGNMYEFSVSGAVVVTGVFLAVLSRRDIRYLGTFVVGPVLLTLGLAVAVLYTRAAQLVPALQSYWLLIHVTIAFVASALFTLAFSTTVLQLVQERRELARAAGNPPRRGRFMDGLPSARDLERSSYRLHVVAFPLWTFTVMAGAIWAEHTWGRYWNWDPKEVWSFVIWVVYAAYLHARATRGWDGRRSAYLALAGYGCILFNFLVVNIFFVGLHSYAGVG